MKGVDSKSNRIKLYFLALFVWQFFHIKLLMPVINLYSNGVTKRLFLAMFVVLFLCVRGKRILLFRQKFIEKPLLIVLLLFAVINCLTCLYFRNQSLMVSMIGWTSFWVLFFYPVLKTWKLKVEDIEIVIFWLYKTILFCSIIQNILVFSGVFIFELDIPEERFGNGQNRVRLFSDAILFLGSIFCWNKFLINRDKFKLIWYILGFFVIFLQGFRMLILGSIITAIVIFFRINGFSKKIFSYGLGSVLLLGLSLQLPIVQHKVEEIIERNEEQSFDNDSYVRVYGLTYFFTEHFLNKNEAVLGSGMPLIRVIGSDSDAIADSKNKASDYSYEMSDLAAFKHVFPADYGFIGLYVLAGIPFTLTFIIFLLRLMFIKVDKKYLYLGGYISITMFCSFTHYFVCYHMNLFALVLVLCILDQVSIKKPHSSVALVPSDKSL